MQIDTDYEFNAFKLLGDTDSFRYNKRLKLSFSRLNYKIEDSHISIPFDTETKIKTLQEIRELLDKFSISNTLTPSTQHDVLSYNREVENFLEFSENARKIRNNEFGTNKDLINKFDDFQQCLKKTLVRDLYPLQLLSAFHMAFAQNSCNFAVPGAGKTSIVYAAYAFLKSLPDDDPRHVDKLLVIGPLSSFSPWEKEYKENFGKQPTVQRLSGDSTISNNVKENHLYSSSPSELTLVFTGGVYRLQDDIISFLKRNKTMVVVDEAHRIKNPDGIWGKSSVAISKEAISRVVLTGTPAPNGYEDLYNLFQFLYPYKFKDILHFHYDNLKDMTKAKTDSTVRINRFTENISPYFIRIKKKDLGLPAAYDFTNKISMDEDQRYIYDYVETNYMKDFEYNSSGTIKDLFNKAKLVRLRQASSNPTLLLKPIYEAVSGEDFDYSMEIMSKMPNEFIQDSEIIQKIRDYAEKNVPQKFIEVERIYKDKILPQNGKVIVWTIFIQNAKSLQSYLETKGITSRLLIGEINQQEREEIIDKFDDSSNSEFQVVIANPFSVAESISLHHGCHNAIYMERDYNCSNFLQSKDRIHRKGLLKDQVTNYYFIVCKESIDEVIDEQLNKKIVRMENIIDQDIPLFTRIDDNDETDLITGLMKSYASRT